MPKLLADFLQEPQSPFALDVFLLERGYSVNKRRRRRRLHCFDAVVRLVSRGKRNVDASGNGGECASDACTTKYNESDVGDEDDALSLENGVLEGEAERKMKWRSMEEGGSKQQLSPVSVLEETESDEGSPPLHQKQWKTKRMSIVETSTSISHTETTYEAEQSNPYARNKRALQQTKRLLVDCVREVIESHRRRDDDKQQLKKILGTEELWKLVCEHVWVWSRDPVDRTNILHLLRADFAASEQDWDSGAAQRKEEIAVDVGDAVLEDIIDEIVSILCCN